MAISSDAEPTSDRQNANPKRKMSLVRPNNSARTTKSFKIGVAPNMFSNSQEPSGENLVTAREKVEQPAARSQNRTLGIAVGGLVVGGLVGFLIARRKR